VGAHSIGESDELELARKLLANLRSAISQVADREYQKRVWLGNLPDERSSFIEVYYLIVESDIDVVRANRAALDISTTEWELMLRFLVRFLAYYSGVNDVYAQELILWDPEWAVVVRAAGDVLAARA